MAMEFTGRFRRRAKNGAAYLMVMYFVVIERKIMPVKFKGNAKVLYYFKERQFRKIKPYLPDALFSRIVTHFKIIK